MTEGDPVRHPLVGRNPDNGRNYLFVNVPIFCRSITGMENPEGDALLASLYAHAQRPEFHFRLTWALNTVVDLGEHPLPALPGVGLFPPRTDDVAPRNSCCNTPASCLRVGAQVIKLAVSIGAVLHQPGLVVR